MIEITSIKHPKPGAVVAFYCATCKVTEFVHDYLATAPNNGNGYYKVNACLTYPLYEQTIRWGAPVKPRWAFVELEPDPESVLPSIY